MSRNLKAVAPWRGRVYKQDMDIIVTAGAPGAPRHRGILTAPRHRGILTAPRHRGILTVAGRRFDCALGRSGITDTKREGDGATPAGRFALREIFYRADRIAPPAGRLAARAIAPDDGWCDDPAQADYNRFIRFPFAGGAEHLWRDDGLYDIVVVLGYNDAPAVPGAGSAIFLHVARPDMGATEGCVALAREALIALAAELAPGDAIVIDTRQ